MVRPICWGVLMAGAPSTVCRAWRAGRGAIVRLGMDWDFGVMMGAVSKWWSMISVRRAGRSRSRMVGHVCWIRIMVRRRDHGQAEVGEVGFGLAGDSEGDVLFRGVG